MRDRHVEFNNIDWNVHFVTREVYANGELIDTTCFHPDACTSRAFHLSVYNAIVIGKTIQVKYRIEE